MKLIIRNLRAILYRFKLATLLNILGLSMAFAAFIIILMQVRFEYSYESYHPNADRIYRIELLFPNGNTGWTLTRPFVDTFIQSSPYIEAGTILNPYVQDVYFIVGEGEQKKGFKERVFSCYPEITELFNFSLLEGDIHCLSTPGKVLIPESMSKRIFGTNTAIGEILYLDSKPWTVNVDKFFIVGGIYKDFPDNTQLRNGIYVLMDNDYTVDDWMSQNYFGYILLDKNASPGDVTDTFNSLFDYSKLATKDVLIKLTPLRDIYFYNTQEDANYVKTGNKSNTTILLLIAFLVIIIAAINYTVFSTSLVPLRIKSINTQKVLGGEDRVIRFVLVGEAVLISFISFFLSLLLISLLNRSDYVTFLDVPLVVSEHIGLVLFTALLSLLIGGLSGLYPSYYMTSFPPALVLKGSIGLSPAGQRLRVFLVGFQFVISFVLIISSLFINLQNNYLFQYEVGFDIDQVALVELNDPFYHSKKEIYKNKLMEFSGIEDVAFASCKFGGKDSYSRYTGTYEEQEIGFYYLSVSWNFPELMGLNLTEGEITEVYEQGPVTYLIPNRYLQNKFNIEQNGVFRFPFWPDMTVAGFVEDFNVKSLRYDVDGACLVINGKYDAKPYSYIKIKAGTDIQQVANHIKRTVHELDPAFPFSMEFYDSIFNSLYKKETNMSKMIFLFSLLAIIIALVGVFGLVIFETYYRYKEIGIRKVHGAGTGSILLIFNKYYILLVCISFWIACPVALYGVNEWLRGFAYRTPMYWWIYAIAFLIILFLTTLTVTFQCWKAANSNPVESIKTE